MSSANEKTLYTEQYTAWHAPVFAGRTTLTKIDMIKSEPAVNISVR